MCITCWDWLGNFGCLLFSFLPFVKLGRLNYKYYSLNLLYSSSVQSPTLSLSMYLLIRSDTALIIWHCKLKNVPELSLLPPPTPKKKKNSNHLNIFSTRFFQVFNIFCWLTLEFSLCDNDFFWNFCDLVLNHICFWTLIMFLSSYFTDNVLFIMSYIAVVPTTYAPRNSIL